MWIFFLILRLSWNNNNNLLLCPSSYKLVHVRPGALPAVFIVISVVPRQICGIWEGNAGKYHKNVSVLLPNANSTLLLALLQMAVCLAVDCSVAVQLTYLCSLAVSSSGLARKLLLSSVYGTHTGICLHLHLNGFQNSHLYASHRHCIKN